MPGDFSACLDQVSSQRRKEMTASYLLAIATDPDERVVRAGSLVVLYGHFDKIVRTTLEEFVSFLARQRISYDLASEELRSLIEVATADGLRTELAKTSPNLSDRILLRRLVAGVDPTTTAVLADFKFGFKANITPKRLKWAIESLGLNEDLLTSRLKSLDSILGRRNACAHGELVNLSVEEIKADYQHLRDFLDLLRESAERKVLEIAAGSEY